MRVAVIGATGAAGRHVVDELVRRGHEVVACSRATGQDVVTGKGLAAALEGAETVVDVSNVDTVRRSTALAFFAPAARTLRSAARDAGVAHVAVLSIVGIDRMRSLGYYDAKCTQERLALNGDVPATVVRATQFHELVDVVARRARLGPVAFVPELRVQTVAARSVASVLVDVALGPPWRGTRPDVAGPGPVGTMAELARTLLQRSGSRGLVIPLPLPPAASRPNRDGALLPAPDATVVGPSFAEWLEGPDAPRER